MYLDGHHRLLNLHTEDHITIAARNHFPGGQSENHHSSPGYVTMGSRCKLRTESLALPRSVDRFQKPCFAIGSLSVN